MSTTRNSIEYLLRSSDAALESFQLAQLTRSANLRKDLLQVVNDIVTSEAEARAARWLRDGRRNLKWTPVDLRESILASGKVPAHGFSLSGLPSGEELRANALTAGRSHDTTSGALPIDSPDSWMENLAPVETELSSRAQLDLFSCDEGVRNTAPSSFARIAIPQSEKLSGNALEVVDGSAQSRAVWAPNSIDGGRRLVSRLPRAAKLMRHFLASSSLARQSLNDNGKVEILVLPVSRWNATAFCKNVGSCSPDATARNSVSKTVSICDRGCRNNGKARSNGSALAFKTGQPVKAILNCVNGQTLTCAKQA